MSPIRRVILEVVSFPLLILCLALTPLLWVGIKSSNAEFEKNDKKIRSLLEEDKSLISLVRYADQLDIKFQKNRQDKDITWRVDFPERNKPSGLLFTKYLWLLGAMDKVLTEPIVYIKLSKDESKIEPDPGFVRIFMLAHEIGHLENEFTGLVRTCPAWKKNKICLKSELLVDFKAIDLLLDMGYIAIANANDFIQEKVVIEYFRCWPCIKNPTCQSQFDSLCEIRMKHYVVQQDWRKYFGLWTVIPIKSHT